MTRQSDPQINENKSTLPIKKDLIFTIVSQKQFFFMQATVYTLTVLKKDSTKTFTLHRYQRNSSLQYSLFSGGSNVFPQWGNISLICLELLLINSFSLKNCVGSKCKTTGIVILNNLVGIFLHSPVPSIVMPSRTSFFVTKEVTLFK